LERLSRIKIYSVTGNNQFEETFETGTATLDLSNFKSGIYFLEILDGDGVYRYKIYKLQGVAIYSCIKKKIFRKPESKALSPFF